MSDQQPTAATPSAEPAPPYNRQPYDAQPYDRQPYDGAAAVAPYAAPADPFTVGQPHPQQDRGPAYGQGGYGQAPYGPAGYGPAPYGQAPYGQAPYGQGGYGAYGYEYGAYGYASAVPRTNGMAVAALVCGIAGLSVLPWIASVAAVVLGHVARRQIAERGEAGSGMATAGLVLGYLGSVGWVLLFIVPWLIFAGAAGLTAL